MSAVQLGRDYDANEVAADDKYRGQTLLVTGTVESIDKDMFDSLVLHLASDQETTTAFASTA